MTTAAQLRYVERHPERVRAAKRAWNKSASGRRIRGAWERSRGKGYRRDYYARRRAEIIAMLGGSCQCCGESVYEFLAIDHIHGGGGKERRAGITVHSFLAKVRRDTALYRVLCHNCNQAVRWGVCPHQKGRA